MPLWDTRGIQHDLDVIYNPPKIWSSGRTGRIKYTVPGVWWLSLFFFYIHQLLVWNSLLGVVVDCWLLGKPFRYSPIHVLAFLRKFKCPSIGHSYHPTFIPTFFFFFLFVCELVLVMNIAEILLILCETLSNKYKRRHNLGILKRRCKLS